MNVSDARQDELDALKEQKRWITKELLGIKTSAAQIIEKDLQAFPERELRRRFIENPDFANSLTQKQIRNIKTTAQTGLHSILPGVLDCLRNDEKWLSPGTCHGPGKSFEENEDLWTCVKPVEELVRGIMRDNGFPETAIEAVRYKMPTWFIEHSFLPSMAEKYWQLVRELHDISTQEKEIAARLQRDALAKKWDSA
jgi:hypothetical protein